MESRLVAHAAKPWHEVSLSAAADGVVQSHIPQLTGIRFFAAYLVLCHHFLYAPSGSRLHHFLDLIGDGGVSLFFVLSGMVLTLSNRTADGALRRDKGDYFVARFARLYPLYFLAFLLAAPFAIAATISGHAGLFAITARVAVNAIAYLSMLQSWVPWLANAWNGPGWSLSTEIFFYLCFVFIRPPEGKWLAIYAIVAGCILIGAASMAEMSNDEGNGAIFYRSWMFFPPFRLGEFVLGIVIAQIYRKGLTPGWFIVLSAPIAVGAAVLVCAAASFGSIAGFRAATTLLVPAGLLALALSTGVLPRGLSHPWLLALGEASYGLYLLQAPIFYMCGAAFRGNWRSAPYAPGEFLLYSLIAVSVSLIAYRYWEKPALRTIRAYWAGRSSAALARYPA